MTVGHGRSQLGNLCVDCRLCVLNRERAAAVNRGLYVVGCWFDCSAAGAFQMPSPMGTSKGEIVNKIRFYVTLYADYLTRLLAASC